VSPLLVAVETVSGSYDPTARYVVSDHHFGHANIIGYCDHPVASPDEMNDTLLGRHHETVPPEETLPQLGDVAMDIRDGRETVDRFESGAGVAAGEPVFLDRIQPYACTSSDDDLGGDTPELVHDGSS